MNHGLTTVNQVVCTFRESAMKLISDPAYKVGTHFPFFLKNGITFWMKLVNLADMLTWV